MHSSLAHGCRQDTVQYCQHHARAHGEEPGTLDAQDDSLWRLMSTVSSAELLWRRGVVVRAVGRAHQDRLGRRE